MAEISSALEEIEKKLRKLAIPDLRKIARAVEVKVRQGASNDDWVEAIMGIASNQREKDHTSWRGARPKSNVYDTQLVNEIESCRMAIAGRDLEQRSAQTYGVQSPSDIDISKLSKAFGIVYFKDNNYYLHRFGYKSFSDAFISKSFIDSYNIKAGDCVLGGTVVNGSYALTSVEKVSGSLPINRVVKNVNFSLLDAEEIKPVLQMSCEGEAMTTLVDFVAPIFEGGSTLLVTSPLSERFKYISSISRGFKNNADVKKIVLLIDTTDGEVDRYNEKLGDAEVFCVLSSLTGEEKLREIGMVVNYAKLLAAQSNKVVLLMDGLSQAIYAGMEKNNTAQVARDIFSASKLFSCGSLTIIASILDDNYFNDKGYVSEFSMLADTVVKISGELESKGVYPAVDLQGSYIKNKDLLLSYHLNAINNVKTGMDRSGVLGLIKLINSGADTEQLISIFKD